MKTTIDRVGRIRRVALALWRHLNPLSSAADDGPRSFEEAQPPGLSPPHGVLGGTMVRRCRAVP